MSVGVLAGVALVVGVLVGIGVSRRSLGGTGSAAVPSATQQVHVESEQPKRSGDGPGAPVSVTTAAVAVPQVESPPAVVRAVSVTRTAVPSSGGGVRPAASAPDAGQAVPDTKPEPGGEKKLNDILSERH